MNFHIYVDATLEADDIDHALIKFAAHLLLDTLGDEDTNILDGTIEIEPVSPVVPRWPGADERYEEDS